MRHAWVQSAVRCAVNGGDDACSVLLASLFGIGRAQHGDDACSVLLASLFGTGRAQHGDEVLRFATWGKS
eukprot:363309-Chlamydomonas_euryale.AAC.13